jgi:signal peptidase II
MTSQADDGGHAPDASADSPVTDDSQVDAGSRVRRRDQFALISLAVAAVVIVLDVVTKHWAVASLTNHDERHVIWTLQWNLAYNSGMAFSRGRGLGPIIGLVAIVVVVALVVGSSRVEGRLGRVGAGMILGGAIGNLLDRIFRGSGFLHGAVVDFIDFQWFPIFNVADIGVDVGAVLFALATVLPARRAVGRADAS